MLHWPSGAEEFALQLSLWGLGVLLALGSLHLYVAFPAWAVILFSLSRFWRGRSVSPWSAVHQKKGRSPISLSLPYCFGCDFLLLIFWRCITCFVKIKANKHIQLNLIMSNTCFSYIPSYTEVKLLLKESSVKIALYPQTDEMVLLFYLVMLCNKKLLNLPPGTEDFISPY